MNSLDRYILRQCMTPFLVATFVVTLIVWSTQSLQRADIIVEYSQGLGVFARLSLLIVPSLLSVIIPFSLFAGAIYALQRLHADSEIAVMFAAGVGRLRLGAPILLLAVGAALTTLWINIDLMPANYRIMKQEVAEIRADLASTVLRSGEFTTLANGFTIYVEEARPGGQLIGLLVNDYRNGQHPETYMAQRGLIRDTQAGTLLHLVNGNIQRVARYTGDVSFVRFQETIVNVDTFRNRDGERQLELTERYLSELFSPDFSRPWDRANARLLIAEGHNRLASPLYVFAYVLIAMTALLGGPYSRRGYAMRILVACAAAGGLRIAGFLIQSFTAAHGGNWMQYAAPVSACIVCAVLLIGPARRPPPATPRPS